MVERQKNKNRKTKQEGKEEWNNKRTVERQKENDGKKKEE